MNLAVLIPHSENLISTLSVMIFLIFLSKSGINTAKLTVCVKSSIGLFPLVSHPVLSDSGLQFFSLINQLLITHKHYSLLGQDGV